MTRPEFILSLKRTINDVSGSGFSADQYNDALNHAITEVSKLKIAKNDPNYIFDLGVINGQTVPDNFEKFAGNVPITIKDTGAQRQFFHSQSGTPSVKYYVRRPLITDDTTAIPFNSGDLEALKFSAAIYLKSRVMMNTEAEQASLAALI